MKRIKLTFDMYQISLKDIILGNATHDLHPLEITAAIKPSSGIGEQMLCNLSANSLAAVYPAARLSPEFLDEEKNAVVIFCAYNEEKAQVLMNRRFVPGIEVSIDEKADLSEEDARQEFESSLEPTVDYVPPTRGEN